MLKRQLRNCVLVSILAVSCCLLTACGDDAQNVTEKPQKELLIYCGTTMARPLQEIANHIEKQENCEVTILLGGSENLYQAIMVNKQGDIFLPGMESYIEQAQEEGLISETGVVGFNQAAFLVAKGNPLNIPADLQALLNPDYRTVLGSPESSSIGRETKRMLDNIGIYQKVVSKTLYMTSDSRDLNKAIMNKKADLVVDWKSTAQWAKYQGGTDVILLGGEIAYPHKLVLGLLTYSTQPQLAHKFIQYAISAEGQAIFASYGFGK